MGTILASVGRVNVGTNSFCAFPQNARIIAHNYITTVGHNHALNSELLIKYFSDDQNMFLKVIEVKERGQTFEVGMRFWVIILGWLPFSLLVPKNPVMLAIITTPP